MGAVEGIFAIYDKASDPGSKSCEELALPLRGYVGFLLRFPIATGLMARDLTLETRLWNCSRL